MSIIVAVKGDGCVYLAADSQASNGDRRIIMDSAHGKLRQITPQLAVGCTGSLNQLQAVPGGGWFLGEPRASRLLEDVALGIFNDIRDKLSARGTMEKNKDTGADELPGTLLIAWKDDFCIVDASGALIKPAGDWWAIGSGADVALGTLWLQSIFAHSGHFTDYTGPQQAARWAVQAACWHNIYCSINQLAAGPIITARTTA